MGMKAHSLSERIPKKCDRQGILRAAKAWFAEGKFKRHEEDPSPFKRDGYTFDVRIEDFKRLSQRPCMADPQSKKELYEILRVAVANEKKARTDRAKKLVRKNVPSAERRNIRLETKIAKAIAKSIVGVRMRDEMRHARHRSGFKKSIRLIL